MLYMLCNGNVDFADIIRGLVMIMIDSCPNHKIQFVDKNLLNLLILYLINLMYLISFVKPLIG